MWWIKIQEQYLRRGIPAHSRPPAWGPRARNKYPQLLAIKAGTESVEEDAKAPAVPLKEATHALTYSDSLPLSSRIRVAA